ncbi:rRNA-binding ribosome biosynthesis protein utp25 [Friedmanniomyces endolithicus]|uniref:U3 small nucleolar RNA-associated protein 25 n=1 Tax=Friedmanniomyces endolithicus TaxID=329885 RepID=A0AAN6QRD8_9PEZI|nr:rRNA-binding ribosome biosynthesis protein utp25 [Friedmanniomyces endolithicus]KAK0821118.1 rRNA-binding ribosome biosynthesis protein utp25 [Friedmanniomyces endolithicus]KAK0851769.1 rRNA-binding ribosome biosynthesis protein utp25 [Friedmanniomyces endolithicus]KAK0877968.1 rRNA-binding ribosome biosynthesis protein utp25 [Friedmanniomyces endolithicus]KAK0914535.1 rRNA-binding ribosome biosynthesis protein utp25 [Friedmanniomyces endolithicus]
MAPFRGRARGRGGGRGSSRGASRGGRGGSRGGRGNSRGAITGSKLARSGIRTRAGYRKFDSQRVKDFESESEAGPDEIEGDQSNESDGLSDDEELEVLPTVKAYSALLRGFQQVGDEDGGKRKRRKIDVERPAIEGEQNDAVEGSDVDLVVANDDEPSEDEDGSQDEAETTNGIAGATAGNDNDDDEAFDRYESHFASIHENDLSERLKNVQANEWQTEKQLLHGTENITVSAPASSDGSSIRKPMADGPLQLSLKKRLTESAAKTLSAMDDLQRAVVPYIFNYSDLLLANRTVENAADLRSVACLHSINHVLKGRDRVLKNTARLAHSDEPETLDLRDQGFTRPKVLILVETRQMAHSYGQSIISLFRPEQVENRQRFDASFSAPVGDRDTMPEAYRELFGGNNDNSFLAAMKFTRKTLKFYSAFYASDIILASPLGLRRIIENEDKKKQDHDFLSSIEVVIADQADAMQMQSWENVDTVFRHLNLQPRETHGADFNRVRTWYLDGNAKYLRQTIIFSAYATPEINRLFNTAMLNVAGKAKLLPSYPGTITAPSMAGLGVKQTFSRFDSPSPATDPDARFKYFTSALLPSLLRLPKPADGAQGILVFIPSYFDFIRVRNFFATSTLTQNISFGTIHDYTSVPDQRRARSHFLSGRHAVLLYTQRAHHFFRLKLRGVKRVAFYGVPDNAAFYGELVGGCLGTSLREGRLAPEEAGVRVLFSRWETLGLERVVGSRRVKGMLGGKGDTFDFV